MGTKAYPYFKWSVVLIGIIVCFLLFRRCGRAGGTITKTDTISIKADTIYTDTNTSITYVPNLVKKTLHDTLEVDGEPQYIYLPSNEYPPIVQKALEDYNSTKYYNDTLKVQYGEAVIKDTLRKNRIIGRGFNISQSIPEITNTITLSAPNRVTGYIGLELIGNQTTPFQMTGASFNLQLKNRKTYGIGVLLDKSGTIFYSGRLLIPIRLKK